MVATIHDVAKRAGVGIGTVSSVINNSRAVNQATRQRVQKAIDELDYAPHHAARRLSSGKTFAIGAIIPFFTRPAAVERLRGVMSVIANSDYDFTLFSIETQTQRNEHLRNVPRRGRIDGLIVFSFPTTEAETRRIVEANIPTVFIDSYNPQLNCIYIDNADGGYKATKHLIDLGHQKIAYIGDPMQDPIGFNVSRDRHAGYRQALNEANLPFNPNYHREGNHSVKAGYQMTTEILSLPNPPTAIFAFSDTIALGTVEAARDKNLRVPEELSIIGFDDIEVARQTGLTTVRQQLFETGVMGAEVLLNALKDPNQKQIHTLLATELVIRQTTAAAPTRP